MPILDMNDQSKKKEYEEFIKTSPYGHMMQSINWSKVKDNWDRDYVYIDNPDGEIKAALSILSVKNDGTNAFMYAPRGPICDLQDIETVNQLIKETKPVVEDRNGFLLRIDPEVEYNSDVVELYREAGFTVRSREQKDQHVFSNPRHNMILDIKDKSIDEIMASFKKKMRYKVRQTYKSDVITRMISNDDPERNQAIDTFYDLTEIMAKRQDISYRPKEYFVRLLDAFDDVKIFETSHEGQVLSTCIVASYNNKSFYLYSASSNEKRKYNASTQMNYEAIKYAISIGMEEYDFGGVFGLDASDGLYRFKSSFCGDEGLKEWIGEIDVIVDEKLYEDFNS